MISVRAPVIVSVPLTVWVVPDVNWSVFPVVGSAHVKFWKMVFPTIVDVTGEVKTTVPVAPALYVSVLLQFLETVMVWLFPPRVPAAISISRVTTMLPWRVAAIPAFLLIVRL